MIIQKAVRLAFLFCSLAMVGVGVAESSSPLLEAGDVSYEGTFAGPKDSGMVGGGPCLGMSKEGNLYICGNRYGNVTEITIPTPIKSTVVGDLSRAALLHPYVDLTKGKQEAQENLPSSGSYDFGDVLVVGDDICWTINEYYNVTGRDHLSFGCSESLDASESSGLWHIGPFTDGPPLNYFHAMQTADYLAHSSNNESGGCLLSGRTRAAGAFGGSSGPALYEFCPPPLNQSPGTAIESASVLMTFPTDLHMFPNYKPKDMWRGVAVVERTVMMVVKKAFGPVFYKFEPSGDGKWNYPDDKPQELCDGEGGGYHAGPYEAQIQMFDWEDIQEIKDGQRDPWNVLPYLTFPIPGWWDSCKQAIGAMAYDPVSRRVYITQPNQDGDRPVVHVYRIAEPGIGEPDTQAPLAPTGFQVQ